MVKSKKIYSFFYRGKIAFIPCGLCFYPIQYKGDQYIVTLRLIDYEEHGVHTRYDIYRYSDKSVLFLGHKRQRIDSDFVPLIEIEEGKFLDVTKASDEELKLFIKAIFELYEKKGIAEQEAKEAHQRAKEEFDEWDGKID